MLDPKIREALERIVRMRENFDQPPHDREYLLKRYADLGLAVNLAYKLLADDDCERAIVRLCEELPEQHRATIFALETAEDFAFPPLALAVAVNTVLDRYALDLSGAQRAFVLRSLAKILRDA